MGRKFCLEKWSWRIHRSEWYEMRRNDWMYKMNRIRRRPTLHLLFVVNLQQLFWRKVNPKLTLKRVDLDSIDDTHHTMLLHNPSWWNHKPM
jgi:hypothetical protein